MIALPWPPAVLNPNTRAHWRVRAAAVNKLRFESTVLTRAAGIQPPDNGPFFVVLTAHPPARYPYDLDNLLARCKALLDGVADGLGVNDRRFVPIMRLGAPAKPARVDLEFHAVGDHKTTETIS